MKKLVLIGCLFLTGCEKLMPTLFHANTAAPSAALQIHVLAGQSNMSGDGVQSGCPTGTNPNLMMYKNNHWQTAQQPTGQQVYARCDPGMAYGLELLRMNPSQRVGIINCAVAATPISMWQGNPNDYLTACMDQMQVVKKDGTVVSFIFMQGEVDAMTGYTNWPQDFLALTRTLQTRFGSSLKIVYGQIGAIQHGSVLYDGFRADQASVAHLPFTMITTMDLPMADAYHFNIDGMNRLGQRFADALTN